MPLLPRHKKFLIIENGLGPMFTNVLINGGITWLVFGWSEYFPIESTTIDLLSTAFFLPFITVFLAYGVTGKQVKSEKLEKLPADYPVHELFKNNVVLRAFVLGFVGVLIIGVPTVLLFTRTVDMNMIPTMGYVYFKGIWAGGFALLFSPIAGWWALKKHSQRV